VSSADGRPADRSTASDNVLVAAVLAAVSLCIRPTMLVFWAYLQLETTVICWATHGPAAAAALTVKTLLGG
jgi:hypothetical protein